MSTKCNQIHKIISERLRTGAFRIEICTRYTFYVILKIFNDKHKNTIDKYKTVWYNIFNDKRKIFYVKI